MSSRFQSKRVLKPPPRVPLQKIQGVGYELTHIQNATAKATEKARNYQPTKGRRLTVTVANAPKDVPIFHGLGRKPQGYTIEKRSAPCDDYFVRSNSRYMIINVSADAELTVWVY